MSYKPIPTIKARGETKAQVEERDAKQLLERILSELEQLRILATIAIDT